MIDPALSFEGFDARSWTRLLGLLSPRVADRLDASPLSSDDPESEAADPSDAGGTVTLIVDEQHQPLKAIHSVRGRIRDATYTREEPLEHVASRYQANRVLVIQRGALPELFEEIGLLVNTQQDYVSQWITVAGIVRRSIEAEQIRSWPRPLANVPIPSTASLERAMDLILPVHQAMAVVLWSGGEIWTAAVLRRGARGIDRILGPDLILDATGPLGGDWRRDHRVITRAIGHELAPLHLGLFAELDTMTALLRTTRPGAWARALAVKDIVVYPTPGYVRLAMGADVARAVVSRTSSWALGLKPLRALEPFVQNLQNRVLEVASVTETLGFNPLAVLAQQVRGDDQSTDDPPTDAPQY